MIIYIKLFIFTRKIKLFSPDPNIDTPPLGFLLLLVLFLSTGFSEKK